MLTELPVTFISGPGGAGQDAAAVWHPSCANVSLANPSHSTDGSNAFEPSTSPDVTLSFRLSVLSAVEVNPVPHSVPGSNPIWPITSITVEPFLRTTASSPLNQPEEFVWSACARIIALALACATTNTSPF